MKAGFLSALIGVHLRLNCNGIPVLYLRHLKGNHRSEIWRKPMQTCQSRTARLGTKAGFRRMSTRPTQLETGSTLTREGVQPCLTDGFS